MILLWAGLACTGDGEPSTPAPLDPPVRDHPRDDELSLVHAQVVGTHNSYHVETTELGAWAYTHRPLDEQIAEVGVRQVELDLYWVEGEWRVFHVPVIDEGTTCATLADCLDDLLTGSRAVGGHLPIVLLLEIKEVHDLAAAVRIAALDDALLAGLGRSRLIVPDDLGGTSADVSEGMADGWPVLSGQRGRFIPVIHDRGDWARTAREVLPESLFIDGYGDLDAPWAAYHSMNDPTDPRIAEVVAAGHIVRTRADVDTIEARSGDTTRRELAMDSGAVILSTDFPEPHSESGYVVAMPDGLAARCNPISAPVQCEALQLEDPALLGP